jgi:hypothetical protein
MWASRLLRVQVCDLFALRRLQFCAFIQTREEAALLQWCCTSLSHCSDSSTSAVTHTHTPFYNVALKHVLLKSMCQPCPWEVEGSVWCSLAMWFSLV